MSVSNFKWSISSLQKHDRVDVKLDNGNWSLETITNIYNKRIRIESLYGRSTWVYKTTEHIAPPDTHTLFFNESIIPEAILNQEDLFREVIYNKSLNSILFKIKSKFLKYDIKNQKYSYINGEYEHLFSCHIPDPINEYHSFSFINQNNTSYPIIRKSKHSIYDISQNKLKIANNSNWILSNTNWPWNRDVHLTLKPSMIYLNILNKMIVCSSSKSMFECLINIKNQNNYIWKPIEIFAINNVKIWRNIIVEAYGQFVIIFGDKEYDNERQKCIYFMDLNDNTLYKSDIKLAIPFDMVRNAVSTSNNNIHIFAKKQLNQTLKYIHFYFKIKELIPKELILKFERKGILVCGYVKFVLPYDFPFYLMKLISKYYYSAI